MSRPSLSLKHLLLGMAILTLPLFTYLIWTATTSESTIATLTKTYQTPGTSVKQDLQSIPSLPFTQEDTAYTMTDTTSDGIDIQFANQSEQTLAEQQKPKLSLTFPKNYSEPVSIKLDDQRMIEITDLGGKSDYAVDTLSQEQTTTSNPNQPIPGFFKKLFSPKEKELPSTYLRYTSRDERKELLYAYQKDQASGEKKLKHWTLYDRGDGIEKEEYQFKNAKLRINGEGVAEVFYYGEQDLKNDQAVAEVDTNLLERAQRTLAKEMGEDIMNGTSGKTPDFTIPAPYYLDKNGDRHEAEWKVNEETNTLSVNFTPEQNLYPVALDPTLSFTAPGVSNGGSVITGEDGSDFFGSAFLAGDFNADGKTDLIVGSYGAGTVGGRIYIFYNDGQFSEQADGADSIIGATVLSDQVGIALAAGDFNADGRMDFAISGDYHNHVWIFYNDGTYPATTATADVHLSGDESSYFFGRRIVSGDFNADGKTDIAVGADDNTTQTGRAYVFYADGTNNYGTASCTGSLPTTCLASNADVKITGEATSDHFGFSLASGDFNMDGKVDLAVGSYGYSTNTGRAYIFYNGSIVTENASGADVIITGSTAADLFGIMLTAGDFNADGQTDLAVSATQTGAAGKVYLFYGDGTIPTTAGTADVTITGKSGVYGLGRSPVAGDFNADGRMDLAVGAAYYTSDIGEVYVFYSDGSYPTNAANADVVISGQGLYSHFGDALATGDWNADGRTDLVVGAPGYRGAISQGRAYVFYSQNGQVNTNQAITGETTSNNFGTTMTTGDFNADGKTDLAVGATGYSTNAGRVYVFYGDGQIPSVATSADVIVTGEASSSFGTALTAGDFNADGKIDLAVGASLYSTTTGRTYIFYNGSITTESASGADIIITGQNTLYYFGSSLTSGDFNADGKTDLAVSAPQYSSSGRTYIFYGGSIITEGAGGADIFITGSALSYFGSSLTSGDFNADGKIDLVVGAGGYAAIIPGNVYIFYNGSITTESASGADITIADEAISYFGYAVASGDFNADGRTDLAVGAYSYSTNAGRAYIFYNDGSLPTTAATADVIINGEASSYFGSSMTAGDFNADGRTDLAVGAYAITTNTGRVYLFYNDSSLPTTAATADTIIIGETTNNYLGYALTVGDMNGDGRTDLIVGAYGNSTSTGKVYFYETRENFAWQIQKQFGSTPRTGLNTSGQELQITGETGTSFGTALTAGDWNADGKIDLAIGAYNYSSQLGRTYLFYNDGSLATGASNADIVISGESTANLFGWFLASGDWNADGKTDLAVSARGYTSDTGRTYLFYNDGSIPTTAATADVIITGETTSNYFGQSLVSGDFNFDGKTDLAVGAFGYSSLTGRAYIFYNGSIITENASGADIILTGETASDLYGSTLVAGDWNADGKTDLSVGARNYSSGTGRAYIFYNGSIITENASGADIILTGETASDLFGTAFISGDFNADGKTDFGVGATGYSSSTGRAYIFYNGSIITENASGADIILTGETTSNSFGTALTAGDWNTDGKTDFGVGATGYSSSTGRAYIFYNGSIITENASGADIILTGETTSNSFGTFLFSEDWNADGKTDLAVGASGYSSSKGKVYIYTFNDPVITGGATGDQFGYALATGDFNADGKIDLVVGANGYSSSTGRAYIFYNDGVIPNATTGADIIITGETAGDTFGSALMSGDWNADGKTDLVIGAPLYSTHTGRAYLFYADGTNNFGTVSCSGTPSACLAANADVAFTGIASYRFGASFAAGDLDGNGRVDLLISTYSYDTYAKTVYLYYNDGTYNTTAATADVIFSGSGASQFGSAVTTGDFNTDGRTDLAVSDNENSVEKVYLFYSDGTNNYGTATCSGTPATCSAADADTIITNVSNTDFGAAFATGDFNVDGRTDLVVGAPSNTSTGGSVYIFYNDGSYPAAHTSADVTISSTCYQCVFGGSLATGDWNVDGRTDLAVGEPFTSSNTGNVYFFYNDGSLPTTAATADVTLTGKATSNMFGCALASADFNSDGRVDLVAGAYGYSSSTGQVYLFTSEVAPALIPPGTSYLKGTGKLKGTMKWK